MTFIRIIAFLLYLSLGIFQFAATFAGLEHWLGVHWIIAAPISLFISYIPLAGTIIGMIGAVTAWHWTWGQAAALFLGPLLLVLLFSLAAGGIEMLTLRRHRRLSPKATAQEPNLPYS